MLKKLLGDRCGFNLRERVNVYSGIFLGATVPIAIMRYGGNLGESNSFLEELGKWGMAAVLSTPLNLAGAGFGIVWGMNAAGELQYQRRRGHPRNYEESLEDDLSNVIDRVDIQSKL